jgi:hypothetical protein
MHTYMHTHTQTHKHTYTQHGDLKNLLHSFYESRAKISEFVSRFNSSWLYFVPDELVAVRCHRHRCCSFVLLSDDRLHRWYFSRSADEEILQHMLAAEISLLRTQVPTTYLILSQTNAVHTFILYNFSSPRPLFFRLLLPPKSSFPHVRFYYNFICIYHLSDAWYIIIWILLETSYNYYWLLGQYNCR